VLLGVFLLSGFVLIRVVNRLWSKGPAVPEAPTAS
jgi:hypothetical protein